MAGSYAHCVNKITGSILPFSEFVGMIENLGDSYEACEEMVWIINYLAGGNRMKIREAINAYYRAARDR